MSVVNVVKLELPEVTTDRVEDFLATDDLFIDYFNTFLNLPAFPEPLVFNKNTGGFEVTTSAKKELSKKIKDAIRSQKKWRPIYRHVKRHCHSNIPLLPIDTTGDEPKEEEIETSFLVTTLNKEQGINWIKEQRVPAFLQSTCYYEYRLAKVLSQVQVAGPNGEYIIMELDWKPEPKSLPKVVIEIPVDPIDEKMKEMHVSMGSACHTDTELWYNTVVNCGSSGFLATNSIQRPVSSVLDPLIFKRPASARPVSNSSERQSDSGYASPAKTYFESTDSRLSSAFNRNSTTGLSNSGSAIRSRRGVHTPRPSEKIFEVIDGQDYQPPVYYDQDKSIKLPKLCVKKKLSEALGIPQSLDYQSLLGQDSVMVGTIDEVGAQLVAKAIIQSLADVYNVPLIEVPYLEVLGSLVKGSVPIPHEVQKYLKHDNVITDIIPSIGNIDPNQDSKEKVSNSAAEDVSSVVVFRKKTAASISAETNVDKPHDVLSVRPERIRKSRQSSVKKDKIDKSEDSHQAPVYKVKSVLKKGQSIPKIKYPSLKKKKKSVDNSDADSLLDSDDDYEKDDFYFKKKKPTKEIGLNCKKGVEMFKKFIEGTIGESLWNFWIDVERSSLRSLKSESQYLAYMSQTYQLSGSIYELPYEIKLRLGLTSANWDLSALRTAQNKAAEPLILYWTTRFLFEQSYGLESQKPSRKYPLIKFQPTLLPHRPATCKPRLQSGAAHITRSAYWRDCKPYSSGYYTTRPDTEAPDVLMHLNHSHGDHWTWVNQLDYRRPQGGFGRNYLPETLVKTYPWPYVFHEPPRHPTLEEQKVPYLTPRMIVNRLKATKKEGTPTNSPRPKTAPNPVKSTLSPTFAEDPSDDDGIGLSEHDNNSSRASSVSHQTQSDFQGGRRMESLLQALHSEREAGGFFRMYLEKRDNELLIRYLNLWHSIQEYHDMFYTDILDEYALSKKAWLIYSTFVVEGASLDVKCDAYIRNDIHRLLSPPYEDIFDGIEEKVLDELFVVWTEMIVDDLATYSKVQQVETTRYIETNSRFVLNLQKKGIIREKIVTPEDPMAGFVDPVYDPSLHDLIPEEFANFTLDKLIRNRIELEHFREFLAENYASLDLQCWMDIESFRRLPPEETQRCDDKAKDIKLKYLNKKYFFGPSSPAGKAGQDKVMEAGGGWGKLLEDRAPNAVILEAQKYVQERLDMKWLPLYLVTPGFAARQRPPQNMHDVIDDMVTYKRRKAYHLLKLMENKWIASSKDIITFRKALLNPITAHLFQRFVSIKGDNLENDVLFWQQVQKYKEIHQSSCDEAIITQKIHAIISCFIDSHIPPSIQIDITPEQAEKIIERKHEKGPYLFRDAQLSVFRIMFAHWNEFCEYRSKIAEDKILSTIERRRREAREIDDARQQQFEEQEKIRLEYERQQAVIDEDHDDYEDYYDEKDSVTWTYSQHMLGLQHEEMLNKVGDQSLTIPQGAASVKSLETVSAIHTDQTDTQTNESISQLNISKKQSSSKESINEKTLAKKTSGKNSTLSNKRNSVNISQTDSLNKSSNTSVISRRDSTQNDKNKTKTSHSDTRKSSLTSNNAKRSSISITSSKN